MQIIYNEKYLKTGIATTVAFMGGASSLMSMDSQQNLYIGTSNPSSIFSFNTTNGKD